jgi:cytochrome c5
MSDAHDSHTGPIKTPKQLFWTAFFSFVAPVFLIIGLVFFVTKGDKPSPGTDNSELATAIRIQRVGSVELRDANRVLQNGESVYRAQCAACHDAGLVGAPKFGAAADWSARLGTGLDNLVKSALQGKGAMGAQGGGAFEDLEIARAVVFLVNSAGGNFEEPAQPAPAE